MPRDDIQAGKDAADQHRALRFSPEEHVALSDGYKAVRQAMREVAKVWAARFGAERAAQMQISATARLVAETCERSTMPEEVYDAIIGRATSDRLALKINIQNGVGR